MKTLTQEEYYKSLAFFLMAKQKHLELLKLCKEVEKTVGSEKLSDSINDAVYSSEGDADREEFDKILSENGAVVDWAGKSKKEKKNEQSEKPVINSDK